MRGSLVSPMFGQSELSTHYKLPPHSRLWDEPCGPPLWRDLRPVSLSPKGEREKAIPQRAKLGILGFLAFILLFLCRFTCLPIGCARTGCKPGYWETGLSGGFEVYFCFFEKACRTRKKLPRWNQFACSFRIPLAHVWESIESFALLARIKGLRASGEHICPPYTLYLFLSPQKLLHICSWRKGRRGRRRERGNYLTAELLASCEFMITDQSPIVSLNHSD